MRITVKKPATLLELLTESYPGSPRTRIKKILQNGVSVNSRKVTLHSFRLKQGDIVEIKKEKTEKGPGIPFPILFEDESLVIIDKPAGISTSSIDGSRNVHSVISKYLREKSRGNIHSWVVHRLDKEVSGVLLFAKSEEVMEKLKNNWDKAEKRYMALVEGIPENPADTIRSWLAEAGKQKVRSFRPGENINARLAITEYKVVKKVGKYTLLDVKIITGRKNQIRVHLSEMGCPIVGDRKYGAEAEFERRVRLHAYSLSLPHPVTGRTLKTESPLPGGFLSVKQEDEKYK